MAKGSVGWATVRLCLHALHLVHAVNFEYAMSCMVYLTVYDHWTVCCIDSESADCSQHKATKEVCLFGSSGGWLTVNCDSLCGCLADHCYEILSFCCTTLCWHSTQYAVVMCLCIRVSVLPSHPAFYQNDQMNWAGFGMETSFHLSHTVLQGNSDTSKKPS